MHAVADGGQEHHHKDHAGSQIHHETGNALFPPSNLNKKIEEAEKFKSKLKERVQ